MIKTPFSAFADGMDKRPRAQAERAAAAKSKRPTPSSLSDFVLSNLNDDEFRGRLTDAGANGL
jgi:hypothetical protein